MQAPAPPGLAGVAGTACFYRSGDALRSRSVGAVLPYGQLDVPTPPARLLADWQRETAHHLALEPGDVEPMPLARTRSRWPDYRRCVDAVEHWTRGLGLGTLLADSEVALMACRGARYHHDGAQYGGMAFCNLFLSEDRGLDLHFAATGLRIPLQRGTAVLFDTCQPHAVVARQSSGFDSADFPDGQDLTQVFLSWELPIENALLAQVLQLRLDTDPHTAARLDDEQLWINGAPALLCAQTGCWYSVFPGE